MSKRRTNRGGSKKRAHPELESGTSTQQGIPEAAKAESGEETVQKRLKQSNEQSKEEWKELERKLEIKLREKLRGEFEGKFKRQEEETKELKRKLEKQQEESKELLEKQQEKSKELLEKQQEKSKELLEKQQEKSKELLEKQQEKSKELLEKQQEKSKELLEKQADRIKELEDAAATLSPESNAIIEFGRTSQRLIPKEAGYPGFPLRNMGADEIVDMKENVLNDSHKVLKVKYLPHILSLYYICPFKIDGNSYSRTREAPGSDSSSGIQEGPIIRKLPVGSTSRAMALFYDVSPKFHKMDPEILWKTLDRLNDSFENTITDDNFRALWKNLRQALGIDPTLASLGNEAEVRGFVSNILESNSRLLSILGLSLVCREKLARRQPKPKLRLQIDLAITLNGKPLLVFETKRRGLDVFLNEDDTLMQEHPDFVKIIKQCTVYMKVTGLPHIFLTDFTTTIFISLDIWNTGDLKGNQLEVIPEDVDQVDEVPQSVGGSGIEEGASSQKGRKRIGYDYTYVIIKAGDTPVTLQAVFSSMLLHQFAIGVMKKDFKETETLKKSLVKYAPFTRQCLDRQNIMLPLLNKMQKPHSVVAKEEAKTSKEHLEGLKQYIATLGAHVDLTKFKEVVEVYRTSDNELDEIRVGSGYLSNVYSFHFNNDWDRKRLFSVPELGSKLVLKVYDIRNRTYTDPPVEHYFTNEIVALSKVREYNKTSVQKVGVPEVYDFGIMTYFLDSWVDFTGYYILMSYVEEDGDMGPEEIKDANKKIAEDIKSLKEMGINHGDIKRSNKRINRRNPMLIDYSHATTLCNT